jgi:tetratricopeptide (TPR) repeat protein
MKSVIIGFCASFLFVQASFGQLTEKQILDLIAKEGIAVARSRVQRVAWKYPASPAVAYFAAILEENGSRAYERYRQVVARFHGSNYAARALYRMAQYNFAKGNYFTARKQFLDLKRIYPDFALNETAVYYAAKCLFAAGEVDSAAAELVRLARQAHSQLIINLASEDLEILQQRTGMVRSGRETAMPLAPGAPDETLYSVMIGSYSERENAESQKQYFALMGYPVEVKEVYQKKRTDYLVLIGRFKSKAEAERFGAAFKSRFGLKYRIVNVTAQVP